MKVKIVKKNEYSRGKWRLVYDSGDDVFYPKTLEIDGKKVRFNAPICADTKDALIENVLSLMVEMSTQLRKLNGDKKPRTQVTQPTGKWSPE